MLPLIFLALGLGAALAAYEFSPRAHSTVDSYVSAFQSALASHRAADAYLNSSNAVANTAARHAERAAPAWSSAPPFEVPEPTERAPDPSAAAAEMASDVAVDQAVYAMEANQEAARNTADAALAAQTDVERQAAAQSAALVIEREQKITDALANLGVGQCGVRSYENVTDAVRDALLARLSSEGMEVMGDNPWNITTNQHGVKLRAVWDPTNQVVKLIVTAGEGGYLGFVTCDEIWKKIDPLMQSVIG